MPAAHGSPSRAPLATQCRALELRLGRSERRGELAEHLRVRVQGVAGPRRVGAAGAVLASRSRRSGGGARARARRPGRSPARRVVELGCGLAAPSIAAARAGATVLATGAAQPRGARARRPRRASPTPISLAAAVDRSRLGPTRRPPRAPDRSIVALVRRTSLLQRPERQPPLLALLPRLAPEALAGRPRPARRPPPSSKQREHALRPLDTHVHQSLRVTYQPGSTQRSLAAAGGPRRVLGACRSRPSELPRHGARRGAPAIPRNAEQRRNLPSADRPADRWSAASSPAPTRRQHAVAVWPPERASARMSTAPPVGRSTTAVSTGPGQTPFTRMPCGPNSSDERLGQVDRRRLGRAVVDVDTPRLAPVHRRRRSRCAPSPRSHASRESRRGTSARPRAG